MKRILPFVILLFTLCVSPVLADVTQVSNLSITATVNPQAGDYKLSLGSSTQERIIPQNTIINYSITYGASGSASFDSPTKIVADWKSSDAASGVHVLDYIGGSATRGYGNTTPEVDLENRTITWNLPSLPPGTVNQQVNFNLRTNTNYTGQYDIQFTVRANLTNQYITFPEQLITKSYRFSTNPNPNAPTGIPETTPETPPSAPEKPSGPAITNLSFTDITSSTATLLVNTSKAAKMKVMYGTYSRGLGNSLTTGEYTQSNKVTLDGLFAATNYYLSIVLTDRDDQTTTSEVFVFHTAEKSTPPDLQNNIIVVTSGGNILFSDIEGQNQSNPVALLTPDSDYELNYALRHPIALKSIDAIIRNKVLAITNTAYAADSGTIMIPMTEKSPSTYFAPLKTLTPGQFEVYVRIADVHGNITEQKVAELKVMQYLSVFDDGNKQPIGDSRVFISYYNMLSGNYEPLAHDIFSNIPNPSYSLVNGAVKINLPPGRYRALVSAFGYAQKSVDFVLGANAGDDFPNVFLHKDQTNVLNYINYYGNALSDLTNNVTTAVNGIAVSVRFFNLLATFILLVTIFVTFVFFSLRTRVYLRHVFPYFTHHITRLTRRQPLGTFCAIITDEQGKRIQGALLSVLDDATGELLTSITTNTVGVCYLFNPKEHKNLKLLIIKQGYQPKTVAVESDIAETPNGLTIVLKKGQRPAHAVFTNIIRFIEAIAGRFFEVSLFVSFILEFFFMSVYGWNKTVPFFALSFINLLLWIMYQKEKQDRKVFKKV